MNESDLQKLIRMAQMSPALRRADQSVQNTARMRGLGPDDPIEWEAFSTAPEQESPTQSPLAQLLGILAPSAAAQGGKVPGAAGMGGLWDRLMMLGFDPEKEGFRVTR